MPRIVADANIYISALNFAGTADEVLALGCAGLIEICISPAIINEVGGREVARAGRKVYERHRADFERRHQGKYVLIDIRTERIYLAESRRLPHGVDTRVTR